MHPVWAQRREEVLSDCLVSPDVFNQMVDRLGEFGFCRKVRCLELNPKIGCQKFNGLETPELSKK
jgi:hypothetical protein